MTKFGFGQPVHRVEDPRLLTGHGRYTDDVNLPRQAYAHVLRSPHAHAQILALDTAAAAAAPGVLAVLTGADVADDGLGTLPSLFPHKNRDGNPSPRPPRPLLAIGRVRYIGEPVALVVAETVAQAKDAAELIEIDYDILPAVTGTAEALAPDAPQIWPQAPGNLSHDLTVGDKAKVDAAFAGAAHVTRLDLVITRVAGNPMENRAALGIYEPADDSFVLYTGIQGQFRARQVLSQNIFEVPENRVRVITRDMGGGFGVRGSVYPEMALVLWASRRIGRPVKWTGDRSETFMTDDQGRDNVTSAELALDAEGRVLGMRVVVLGSVGAYLATMGPIPTTNAHPLLTGLYDIPALHVEVRVGFSNTTPISPYRGAGRPEAMYVLERLMDAAARETGIDRAELRRRNLIPRTAMPYRTTAGLVYDSGDFPRNMEQALQAADYDGFESRRQAARAQGRLRGIGIANYIERCGGGSDDWTEIRFDPSGTVNVLNGLFSHGQGHETVFAHMVASALGVPLSSVRVIQGDTDRTPFGRGTGGSRSMVIGGGALAAAVNKVIEKGKRIAAHMLEAAEADVEFADGRFTIAGTDRSLAMVEIARASFSGQNLPTGEDPGIDEIGNYFSRAPTFPNGCHVCEVEIDEATGAVRLASYVAVDDVGVVINPLLLDGQIHGGIVQGVGQALSERIVHDPESGQLLTGSFMDYGMPRADDVPSFSVAYNEVPCATNPLGVKGAGEAGTVGALPAVMNAVVDALAPLGVCNLDMPATPERVWQAICGAKNA